MLKAATILQVPLAPATHAAGGRCGMGCGLCADAPPSYQRSAQMPYPLTLPLDQTVYVMMQEVALRCTLSPLPGAHGKATKIPLMA